MILKIERHDGVQRWWFLDKVDRMSISEPRKYKSKEDVADESTIIDEHIFISDHNSDNKEYYLLICKLSDGKELLVCFDTVLYVLNDEGKILERVVVNYRYDD